MGPSGERRRSIFLGSRRGILYLLNYLGILPLVSIEGQSTDFAPSYMHSGSIKVMGMVLEQIRDFADYTNFAALPEDPCQSVVLAFTDSFARFVLSQQLQAQGYKVYVVNDGRMALDTIRERHPDLVICESALPGIGGEDLCRRIRSEFPDNQIYTILLSDERIRPRGGFPSAEENADQCIGSPCDPAELLQHVRSGLRVAELQKMLAQRSEEYRQLTGRLNQELAVVANIQKSLLPQKAPSPQGLDFAWFYLPSSECGGDYYDFQQLDEEHLGFVIADVSGHGAPAMVAMALIRQDFHIICDQFREPHLLLEELNRMLFDHLPTDQYATMFYAIINTRTLVCSYASAGHNPPIWFKAAAGDTDRLKNCEGFPLKLVTRDARYSSHSIQLEHGDKLVFYTDGIPECFNSEREIYGMERFEEGIRSHARGRSPRQIESMVVTDLMCFADNHPQEDDLTLIIIGVR